MNIRKMLPELNDSQLKMLKEALLTEVVGGVPEDLHAYGNELRGRYGERREISQKLEEFFA